MWGAFAYIGADLHARFGLSFTLIGLSVALLRHRRTDLRKPGASCFVYRLGQTGLAVDRRAWSSRPLMSCLHSSPIWWLAPIATTAIGLGFYMLHNTLQTKATQMTPQARGTAVAILLLGTLFRANGGRCGGALVIDRLGAAPLFLGTAVAFPMLAIWFAYELRRAQHQS